MFALSWKNIEARTIVATIVTAYVSNKSAAIPAQSPTLSPTLSAITAGFLGSSSGIPASTFPTKSAPTSAPLVKIPPPNLAKIDIKEAPNPKAINAFINSLLSTLKSIVPSNKLKLIIKLNQQLKDQL